MYFFLLQGMALEQDMSSLFIAGIDYQWYSHIFSSSIESYAGWKDRFSMLCWLVIILSSFSGKIESLYVTHNYVTLSNPVKCH